MIRAKFILIANSASFESCLIIIRKLCKLFYLSEGSESANRSLSQLIKKVKENRI